MKPIFEEENTGIQPESYKSLLPLIGILDDSTNVYHYIRLHTFYREKSLTEAIHRLNNMAFTETDTTKLLEYYDIYTSCLGVPEDSAKELNLPFYLINTCNNLITHLSKKSVQLSYISGTCSSYSWEFLINKEYSKALDFSKAAFNADSTNYYALSRLGLSYILTNQYDKYEEILNKWKYNQWTSSSGLKPFWEMLVSDIETLESKSINHADFAKIKEILKK